MNSVVVPISVLDALHQGAVLAISVSGGKDSQAMSEALWHDLSAYRHAMFLIHAHLGSLEWPESWPHIQQMQAHMGIPLCKAENATYRGDMLVRWQARMKQLQGQNKPFWSSAAQRYCTSDMKRTPINKHLRQHNLVISAEGIRGDESRSRAKKPRLQVRVEISSVRYQKMRPADALDAWTQRTLRGEPAGRLALTWYPIFDWSLEDVFTRCGTSSEDLRTRQQLYQSGHTTEALTDWPMHPAYVYGNQRVSCVFCILATKNDLCVGKRHHPDLHAELVQMERESGFTFRKGLSLAS